MDDACQLDYRRAGRKTEGTGLVWSGHAGDEFLEGVAKRPAENSRKLRMDPARDLLSCGDTTTSHQFDRKVAVGGLSRLAIKGEYVSADDDRRARCEVQPGGDIRRAVHGRDLTQLLLPPEPLNAGFSLQRRGTRGAGRTQMPGRALTAEPTRPADEHTLTLSSDHKALRLELVDRLTNRADRSAVLLGEFPQRGQLRPVGEVVVLDRPPKMIGYLDVARCRVAGVHPHAPTPLLDCIFFRSLGMPIDLMSISVSQSLCYTDTQYELIRHDGHAAALEPLAPTRIDLKMESI